MLSPDEVDARVYIIHELVVNQMVAHANAGIEVVKGKGEIEPEGFGVEGDGPGQVG